MQQSRDNLLTPEFRSDMQSLIRRKVNKKLKLPTKPKNDTQIDLAPPAPVPGSSLPTGPESAPKVPSPLRSDTRESRESRRSQSKKAETNGGLTAAPAAAAVNTNTGDESEDDSDLDEFAFDHPNTYKDAPWIWIPEVICIQPILGSSGLNCWVLI